MKSHDASGRYVRLFKNGRNQAVRIPREFELPGDTAILRRDGGRLIIEPVSRPSLQSLLSEWGPLAEDWPDVQDLPAEPVKL